MDTALRIKIDAGSAAEANRLTSELEQVLRTATTDVSVTRRKEQGETQDAGTVLIAVLAAPAMVAFAKGPALELARGIADWLRKRNANLTIGPDGGVAVENVRADDVERIIRDALKAQVKK
jgi:hypothetical protein